MITEETPYAPLLERNQLRTSPESWLSVPPLAAHVLQRWCRDVLRSNFWKLFEHHSDYDAFSIGEEGLKLGWGLGIDLPTSGRAYFDDTIDSFTGVYVGEVIRPHPVNVILETAEDDHDFLLNIVDYLLAEALATGTQQHELRRVLVSSRSGWQLSHDNRGLSLRVSPEQEESLRQAASVEDPTAEYLAIAWDAAWRYNVPSIDEAYNGAVKALEANLAPIVTPNSPKPSLGTIISALGDKPEKWDTRFRGAETVQALTAMLDELWKTNSRHAGMPPNSLEEAQDAVTIAVAIVALVRRGFLTRVDSS